MIRVPVVKHVGYNLRICRPFNLSDQDRLAVVNYVLTRALKAKRLDLTLA